jgi:hydrogenase expression/formation protein HypD
MGPGCPVCVTDAPEVDQAVALAQSGLHVVTYGDMMRVPGSTLSLDEARARGARVTVIYAATQAVAIARSSSEPVIFFATGFETTAVATAAILTSDPPPNLLVLSAHKWVPAAMEIVAALPDSKVDGYIAAGHAATITGAALFEPFVARFERPVVIAGFEPLDILAALVVLVEQLVLGQHRLINAFPRCVSDEGNVRAMALLRRVFALGDGHWRGIAKVPDGNLALRPEYAAHDASVRFGALLTPEAFAGSASASLKIASGLDPELLALRRDADACICGKIMTGSARPDDCGLFATRCRPEHPVGACMVSTEGACRIWLEHDLAHPRTS